MEEPGRWSRYDPKTGCCVLDVHVQPNARSSAIAGVHGGALKIRVAAPALDNRANAALIELLCEKLELKPACVAIRHGTRGRRKQIAITAGPDFLRELSLRLAPG
jgi:hypothetical protein